jgi:hypothetical protein
MIPAVIATIRSPEMARLAAKLASFGHFEDWFLCRVGTLPTCFRREERKCFAPMTSNREALALWRLALQLVEAKGVRSENCDGVVTLICRTDTLTIAFTPSRDERPNGLDVWRRHGTAPDAKYST